tara:strand:- start:183 stop:587 length:405 start_codon:yes stop_codon:yes gene_type:complete
MKNSAALSVVFTGIVLIIIVTTYGDASTYVSFIEAKELYSNGNMSKIHVVGKLSRDDKDNIKGIEKSPDMLSFSFEMVDEKGLKENVFYGEPMPPDFLMSEQIVVIGSYNNNKFVADEILLKCPSKYTEEKIKI